MNMGELSFRYGRSDDIEELASSAIEMCRETGDADFPRGEVIEGIRKIFADRERGFYVVAERDGHFAASLQVSPQWLDLLNGCLWWIQCVYVKPAFRKQGCYRGMYEFV